MFEAKEKEPKLSDVMQDALLRSVGDKNQGFIDHTVMYKHRIKDVLAHDEDLLRTLHYMPLIGTEDEVNGDKYLNVCIFDYMKLSDLRTDVKNYICFEVEEKHGNESTVELLVTFRVVAHKDDVDTDWGIPRMDLMASIINKDFAWSSPFGSSWKKDREYAIVANNEYFVRDVSFIALIQNQEYHRMHGNTLYGYRNKNKR